MITVEDFREYVAERGEREFKRQARFLEELQAKEKPTNADIRRAMEQLLCYGNIAYCCASPKSRNGGKECVFRDGILDALGLNHRDYEQIKDEMTKVFYEFMKQRFHGKPRKGDGRLQRDLEVSIMESRRAKK